MPTDKAVRMPHGLIALRERNYALYFIGQVPWQIGSWVEITAVSWIIYEMTNSPFLLGVAGLFRAGPTILLALYGGAMADRLPRRLLLMCTESTMLVLSLVIGALTLAGHLEYWHLLALNLISSTLQAFSVPTRHALYSELVPREAISSAVTLSMVAVRSGELIGPTIAGLALAYGGYSVPFFMNAAGFVVMMVALVLMKLPDRIEEPGKRTNVREIMREGVYFVWKTPLLRMALLVELVAGLFRHNAALITVFVADVLHGGPQSLGLLLSANGVGGLIGMALLVSVPMKPRGQLILTLGAVYSLLLAAFAFSQWILVSAILLLGLGTVHAIWSVTRSTLAQLLATTAMRGRVMSIVLLITRGSAHLGNVQSGFTTSLIGAPATAMLGAAVIGAALVTSWMKMRHSTTDLSKSVV